MEQEDWKIVVTYLNGDSGTFWAEDPGRSNGAWYEFSVKDGYKYVSANNVSRIDVFYYGDGK